MNRNFLNVLNTRGVISTLATLVTLAVLAYPGRAHALSLTESEALMTQHHPLIQRCALDPQIAEQLRRPDTLWNAPQLSVMGEDLLGSAASSGQNYTQWTLDLQQAIPLTGYKSALAALGNLESKSAQLGCERVAQELRQSLQATYLEALYWQEQGGLRAQQLSLVNAMAEGLERQIAQGKRPGVDALHFKNEQEHAELQHTEALTQASLLKTKLYTFWPGVSLSLSEQALQWPAPVKSLAPSLAQQAAAMDYAIAQQSREATAQQSVPDLTVGSAVRWHPESQDLGVNVELGWSLPNTAQYEAHMSVQRYRETQALQKLEYTQNLVQQHVSHLEQQLQQKRQSQQKYAQTLIPRANVYLEKVQQGLLLGKFTLLEALEARRQAYTLKAEELQLRYNIAVLEQALKETGALSPSLRK
jgi:outer membrane protein TolC